MSEITPETTIEEAKGQFVKITEFVTQDQITELKLMMNAHIHSADLANEVTFLEKIDKIFMKEHYKEIGEKLFNYGVQVSPVMFVSMLHNIIIDIYFGEAGYLKTKFSDQEKLALLGWAFFCDQTEEDQEQGAPDTWEKSIIEMRESTSAAFVDTGFNWNLEPRVKMYEEQFLNGPSTKLSTVGEYVTEIKKYETPQVQSES